MYMKLQFHGKQIDLNWYIQCSFQCKEIIGSNTSCTKTQSRNQDYGPNYPSPVAKGHFDNRSTVMQADHAMVTDDS